MFLSKSDFSQVVRNAPLISIDLCIFKGNKILLAKRNFSPAKNYFFVPGGRILKLETKKKAIKRILKKELGLFLKGTEKDKILEIGTYEHFYSDNFADDKSFSTHYIVIAYLILFEKLINKEKIKLDKQHSEMIWFDINNLNKENIKIHKYTLNYLRNPIVRNFLRTY